MRKYIIEIEDVPFSKVRVEDDGVQNIKLYRAKGFKSLVFDKEGIEKLTPLDKALSSELGEAYQKGLEEGKKQAKVQAHLDVCHDIERVAHGNYQQGLDDAWETIREIARTTYVQRSEIFDGLQDILSIVQKFSPSEAIAKLREYEQQKADAEIKVGDIITDGKINYLVIDITDKSYIALQGTDFEPAYIGKDYIKSYHNLHDSKDMRKIAEEINKAMNGEQRNCSTCKYDRSGNIQCIECNQFKDFSRWDPQEGEVKAWHGKDHHHHGRKNKNDDAK